MYGTWKTCNWLPQTPVKRVYLNTFPEHKELPIIEANTDNIYLAIKNLLDNQILIKKFGVKSRDFV